SVSSHCCSAARTSTREPTRTTRTSGAIAGATARSDPGDGDEHAAALPPEGRADPWALPARRSHPSPTQRRPAPRRWRFETHSYLSNSRPLYKAGSTRKVPGRKRMLWTEEDWVEEN